MKWNGIRIAVFGTVLYLKWEVVNLSLSISKEWFYKIVSHRIVTARLFLPRTALYTNKGSNIDGDVKRSQMTRQPFEEQ